LQKRATEKITFTEGERQFLKQSRLARLATSSPSGQPHVVPVGFEFDGKYFYVGGYNLTESLKYRNIQKNNKVALVVDDLVSTNPWTPRFLLVRGTAEIVRERKSDGSQDVYIKITPVVKRSSKTIGQ
jgi:pyridoxamine 5'-phosphate oxidase family protein